MASPNAAKTAALQQPVTACVAHETGPWLPRRSHEEDAWT
jgi:hypothetical protein